MRAVFHQSHSENKTKNQGKGRPASRSFAVMETGNEMADKRPIHTVPHGKGWANRREGADRVAKTFDTKKEAQSAGRDTAKRSRTEHLIHNKDGKIGERNSYGGDPYPPPG